MMEPSSIYCVAIDGCVGRLCDAFVVRFAQARIARAIFIGCMDSASCSVCCASFQEVERSKRKSVCQQCAAKRQQAYKDEHNKKRLAVQSKAPKHMKKPKTLNEAVQLGLLTPAPKVPVPSVSKTFVRNADGVQKGQATCTCGAVKGVDRWGRYEAGRPMGSKCLKCALERDDATRKKRKLQEKTAQEEARRNLMQA